MIDVRFSTWRFLFFAAIVFSVGCQSFKVVSQASIDHQAAKSRQVYSAGMCEAAVQMFAAGTPDRDTVAAIQFVESAGVEAFPALLNHLGDKTEAAQRHFMQESVMRDKDGNWGPFVPTISSACFNIIQNQVEGCWPKLYRQSQVLNRSNVRDWLGQREGRTLGELRIECATLSLEKAKEMQKGDSSDNAKEYVKFFVDNLRQVRSVNQ